MHFDTEFLKKNWYWFVGAIVGLFVLYELLSSSSSSSSSGSTDSGMVGASGQQISQLQAGADIAASQNNAQIQTAAFAAQVADNSTNAELSAANTKTAADLALGLATVNANKSVSLAGISAGTAQTAIKANASTQQTFLNDKALVDTQSIVTAGQVKQTAIIGSTLTTLGSQQASVQQSMIATVGKQISTIQSSSKHASQDYAAITPLVQAELGEGTASGQSAVANAASKASQTASVVGGIASVGNTLLKGLFGGA